MSKKKAVAPVEAKPVNVEEIRTQMTGLFAELEKKRLEGIATILADLNAQMDGLKATRDDAEIKIDALQKLMDDLTGTKAKKGKGTRAKNRTQEEKTALAQQIAKLIEKAGEDGIKGGDISEKVGEKVSAKGFLAEYLPEFKFKTTGERRGMIYFAS